MADGIHEVVLYLTVSTVLAFKRRVTCWRESSSSFYFYDVSSFDKDATDDLQCLGFECNSLVM